MGHIRKKKAARKGDPPEHEQKIQEERQHIAEHLAPELRSWRVMKSLIVKRSVIIDGQKTSVSLEDPFWTDLKKIAHAQQMTLSALVAEIDGTREHGNLSSAIRLFVLRHVRNAAKGTDVARPYIPYDPVREARSR
jgi:predicted DNA-binding ribbon-helix-helix protein